MALTEIAKTEYETHVDAAVDKAAGHITARITVHIQLWPSNFLVIGATTTKFEKWPDCYIGLRKNDDTLVRIFADLKSDEERAETLRRIIENYRNVAIKIRPLFVDDEFANLPDDGLDHEEWFRKQNLALEVSWPSRVDE